MSRAVESSLECLPSPVARAVLRRRSFSRTEPEPRGVESFYDLESENRERRPRRFSSDVPGTEIFDVEAPGVFGADTYRSESDSDSDAESESPPCALEAAPTVLRTSRAARDGVPSSFVRDPPSPERLECSRLRASRVASCRRPCGSAAMRP